MPAMTIGRVPWLSALAGGLIVLAAVPALAQAAGSSTDSTSLPELKRWAMSVGIDARIPTGEFALHVPDGAGGLRLSADRQLARTVIRLGGEIGGLFYDDEKSPYSGEFDGRTLKSATTNHTSINFAMLLRVQRPTGKWRPYADATFGGHTYRTTTTVDGTGYTVCAGQAGCSKYGELTSTQLSDTVLTYGGGAGFTRTITKSGWVVFDCSIRYLLAGEAQYLTNGAIQRDGNTIVEIDITRSRTDAVAVYLGIGIARGFF